MKSPADFLFSIIIPVYNRPDEISDLVASLRQQTDTDFETIIVEDGSTITCQQQCADSAPLRIRYFYKENEGRSIARNYGLDRAEGDFFIFIDSDCILPSDYIEKLRKSLVANPDTDCFGGPDAAHHSFSDTQKAINYSMTSFLTTGGIRGGKVSMEKFTPRTFNMGYSREVYERVGGFREMFSEDIDMSTRIRLAGFTIRLLPDVAVFHKRRVDWQKFWRQVHVFGQSRITLQLLYPGSMKAVHWLPALFVIGATAMIIASFFWPWALIPLAAYIAALWVWGMISTRSFKIGTMGVWAAMIQLFGYGTGFIKAYVWRILLRHGRNEQREVEMRRGK